MNAPLTEKLTSGKAGFSLIEALGAVLILGLTLSAAVASFSFMMRSDRRTTAKTEMDMNSRLLVERLRQDLWRTSREMIMVHPEGEGPHNAIGFPVVRGEPTLTGGTIEWDATVIYHMTDGVPSQVRRTVFLPRDNTLTQEERRTQLAAVVNNGNGAGTFNSGNARTRDLITNLVDWELTVTPARFDAYAETAGRRRFSLGTALLNAGHNTITFEAIGKNHKNTGGALYLGIDSLTLTASGLPREAEWMTVQSSSGAVPEIQNMGTGETWSGNSRLWFPATTDGDSFTLAFENDRWEERNFFETSMRKSELERIFIDSGSTPHTFALELGGDDVAWKAAEQAGDTTGTDATSPHNTAIRIFLRGSELIDGGWIGFNGKNVWATFHSGDGPLRIEEAFIAECVAPGDPATAMNYLSETRTDLLFGGSQRVTFNGTRVSDHANFIIKKDKSYLIGIRVQDPPDALLRMRTWTPPIGAEGMPSSFVVHDADSATFNEATWSTRDDVEARQTIYALHSVRAGHSPEGVYTSPIIDTQVDDPDYVSFQWTAQVPDGSLLELKVRAGSNPSELSDWGDVPVAQSGQPPFAQGRYTQVRARFEPGIDSDGETYTPQLRDFTLSWNGGQRYADLKGIFSVGPDHGIYEVRVNGAPLVQGVTVDVTVFKDIGFGSGSDQRVTSSAFTEVVPRNRGREHEN